MANKAKESRTILEWIKESDENREHLFKMEQLYHLGHFDKYENSKRVDRAEKRLMSRIESLAEVRSRRFSINRYMRYAAIIVLMLLLGGIGVISYQRLTAENMLVAQATNGVKNVILPDGTKVWLHHHASIKYPEQFSADERRVELNGEAYFEVKKNPKQPFIVNSDAMSVRVLGTIFNFNTKSGMHKEEVSLLQGSVEASGNARGESNISARTKGCVGQTKPSDDCGASQCRPRRCMARQPYPSEKCEYQRYRTDIGKVLPRSYHNCYGHQ